MKARIVQGGPCYGCASIWTQSGWYRNYDVEDNVLCFKCYNKIIRKPQYYSIPENRERSRAYNRAHHKDHNPRRVTFKGKVIMLKEPPRTGNCSQCGRTDVITNLHHIAYDDNDPLAHTIELCRKCHASETWKLGQYNTEAYRNRKWPSRTQKQLDALKIGAHAKWHAQRGIVKEGCRFC